MAGLTTEKTKGTPLLETTEPFAAETIDARLEIQSALGRRLFLSRRVVAFFAGHADDRR